jgi:hypothetical protein
MSIAKDMIFEALEEIDREQAADGAYYDRDIECFVDRREGEAPTVYITLPTMVYLTPERARRFGRAIIAAADIADAV